MPKSILVCKVPKIGDAGSLARSAQNLSNQAARRSEVSKAMLLLSRASTLTVPPWVHQRKKSKKASIPAPVKLPTADGRIPRKRQKRDGDDDGTATDPAIATPPKPVKTVYAVQTNALQVAPTVRRDREKIGKNSFWRLDLKFPSYSAKRRKRITQAEAQKSNNSSSNHKQRAMGITYTGKGIEANKDILIIDEDADVVVKTDEAGTTRTVSIRYLDMHDGVGKRFSVAAREIASRWSVKNSNANRTCPEGGMIHLGAKKGAGFVPYFFDGPTAANKLGINRCHYDANIAAKEIAQRHFPEAHDSIQNAMKRNGKTVPEILGGEKGLCDDLIQSKRLENESHVDLDLSKCLSLWTTEFECDEGRTRGWCFVMPFLTCLVDGVECKGVAVKLKHGAGIEWHGREIFHCSTAPSVAVNGTYFGVNRI